MRGTTGRPKGRFGALALTALFILLAFPTSALAQIDVGGTGDKIDETVDSLEQTVDETAGSEGGTVDQTTDPVDDILEGRTSPLDRPLKETAGLVGAVIDSILGGPDKSRRAERDGDRVAGGRGNPIDRVRSAVTDGFAAVVASASTTAPRSAGNSAALGAEAVVTGKSPLEQLIQNIGDVLPRIAFPIALLILVAAFIVIQGRVDKSDPKLALAPIDVDQEYLSFR